MCLASVNLILFEPAETTTPLPRNDPRATHILKVLRRRVGDTFDAGLADGPLGKGTLAAIHADTLSLTFCWHQTPPPPLDPITLIIGLPRPQTARDLLRDAAALGVAELHFVTTDRGESSYAQSTLWSSGEWRHHLLAGAQQAFDTRLPALTHGRTLAEALAAVPPASSRLALDNYESPTALSQVAALALPVTLALGPERGWSAAERDQLRASGFSLVHLGTRVLRAETAAIAALAIVRSKLGLM